MPINALIDQLADNAGDFWFLALIVQFFVMVCEAAKPRPAPGESRAGPQGFALLVMILSLVTPLLLFLHAFVAGSGSVIAIAAVIFGAVIVASVIGWILGAVSPEIGRTLNRAASILALAAFALTLYVTWENVLKFVSGFVAG